MYKVLKSFANSQYVGTKGKFIDIPDKKLVKSLKSAGYIDDISKDDKISAKQEEEIVALKATVSELQKQNEELQKENEELKSVVEQINSSEENEEQIDPEEENPQEIDNSSDDKTTDNPDTEK